MDDEMVTKYLAWCGSNCAIHPSECSDLVETGRCPIDDNPELLMPRRCRTCTKVGAERNCNTCEPGKPDHTVLVFETDLLVEACWDKMDHMLTALAFNGEPGYLGSILVPPDRDVPTFEKAHAQMVEANDTAVRLRREMMERHYKVAWDKCLCRHGVRCSEACAYYDEEGAKLGVCGWDAFEIEYREAWDCL
jgi:hypothetical protein